MATREAIRDLARDEAEMLARHRAQWQAEQNFARRHSLGRDMDAECDGWALRVDALLLDAAEFAAFQAERSGMTEETLPEEPMGAPVCDYCGDSGMVYHGVGLVDCPMCGA